MSTNREDIERGRAMLDGGQRVRAADLKEGQEVLGVGVLEADAEPLGPTHVRLHIGECWYDKPVDAQITIAVEAGAMSTSDGLGA